MKGPRAGPTGARSERSPRRLTLCASPRDTRVDATHSDRADPGYVGREDARGPSGHARMVCKLDMLAVFGGMTNLVVSDTWIESIRKDMDA